MKLIKMLIKYPLYALIIWALGFGLYFIRIPQVTESNSYETADAIVVLTGDSNRLETGLDLLQKKHGSRLLLSGVNKTVRVEDLIKLTGSDPALFACCIDLGRKAENTIGNALETKEWRIQHKFKSILVVTSDYHMPRALLWFQKMDPAGDYQPAPALSKAPLKYFVREYNKYLITLLQNGQRTIDNSQAPEKTTAPKDEKA